MLRRKANLLHRQSMCKFVAKNKLVTWVISCTIWERQTKLATCDLWHAPFELGKRVTFLIHNGVELQDVQGSNDDNIPVDEDNGFYTSPLQQRTASIQLLALQSQAEEAARLRKEVEAVILARRESAVARLACINPSSLPLLLPTTRWTGAKIDGTTPIDTSVHQFSDSVNNKGLHIVELFGGIGLGVELIATLSTLYLLTHAQQ